MATQHSDDLSAPASEAAPAHERRDAEPASREPHESRATGSGRREGGADSAEHDDNRAAGAEQRDTRAGERRAGHVPEGTATDSPPLEGSSLDAPPVQGTYRPDVGPGGRDVDESDQVLTNRSRTARGPDQPSEPVERSRSGLDEVPPNPSALPRS